MTKCLLGPHNADKIYDMTGQNILEAYMRLLQPVATNILRAAEPAGALAIALNLLQVDPDLWVFVRHMFGPLANGDENVLKVYATPGRTAEQAAAAYHQDIGLQYQGTNLLLVAGNEVTFDDYTFWVRMMVELMRLGSVDDVRYGIGRFPAWHPYRNLFYQFEALANAFVKYTRHILTPNWYFTADNYDAIFKGIEWWDWMGRPPICVGEFGLLSSPDDANGGYHSLGIDDRTYARLLIAIAKQLLLIYPIPALYFNRGTWFRTSNFQTGPDFEDELIKDRGDVLMSTPSPSLHPITFWVDVTAQPSLRLRAKATTASTTLATISYGTRIGVIEDASAKAKVGTDAWLNVQYQDQEAYVYALYTSLVPDTIDTVPKSEYDSMVQDYEERLISIKTDAQHILDT